MEEFEVLAWFALIGIGATMVMDLWALTLQRIWKIPGLDYAIVGRWIGHMRSGVFVHEGIHLASKVPGERLAGWGIHYVTGVLFSLAFGKFVGGAWLEDPQILQSALFGILTLIFPFFIFQPSIGVGWAASKTPFPWLARLRSFSAHLAFGIGMYLSAMTPALIANVLDLGIGH